MCRFSSSFFLAADVFLQPPEEQNDTVPLTCSQCRRFAKLLKPSLAQPRFNAGIRANRLHCLYPLRFQQQDYVTPSAPTIIKGADIRNFLTLKDRTLRLQRRAAMLRNSHRIAIEMPNTGQKGEKNNKNMRLRPSWVP